MWKLWRGFKVPNYNDCLRNNVLASFFVFFFSFCKWFEPRSISGSYCVIVRVRVVLKRTDVGDWRFDNLSGSYLQSQEPLTLKMTSAQVVETLVTNNSSFQIYPHPDDHTIRSIFLVVYFHVLSSLFSPELFLILVIIEHSTILCDTEI